MKTKTLLYLFFVLLIAFSACKRTNRKKRLKGSMIQLNTAINFRENFINAPNNMYHIPEALMFETIEFEELFSNNNVDEVRFYPAIDTHNNPAPDSLTLIMVPVNSNTNDDILTGYLFEYADDCPPFCSDPNAAVSAPTEASLNLNIPMSWCVNKSVYKDLMYQAEAAGVTDVYGIRMYWFNNADGIMDFKLCATRLAGQTIVDIPNAEVKGVSSICTEGGGCCDRKSKLARKPRKK